MKKEILVNHIVQKLIDRNYKYDLPPLVDFVDDEIFWDRIAETVIEAVEDCFDEVPWEQR